MKDIIFEDENAKRDSLMVTPIGICLSFYVQSNNFIFVTFNGERLKLYDNGHLTVSDAALQVAFPNEDLFPKRGKAITFNIGGKSRIVRGTTGESSQITINGETADLYSQIRSGDAIEVKASTPGEDAHLTLGELTEMKSAVKITVNGKEFEMPRKAVVNGELKESFYEISEGDDIKVNNFYTVEQIGEFLDLPISDNILVNQTPAVLTTKVYEGFTLEFELGQLKPSESKEDTYENLAEPEEEDLKEKETVEEKTVETKESAPAVDNKVSVTANGRIFTLTGKDEYVFVDIFDKLNFNLNDSKGRGIITLLNGKKAQYLEPLKDGDVIEVRWEDKK
ncbi:MAG: cell division protein FtsA, partial [Lachnospiraceae bacterium]|nr:cell division protein FtsA [Lachnospiraceae bacterium]